MNRNPIILFMIFIFLPFFTRAGVCREERMDVNEYSYVHSYSSRDSGWDALIVPPTGGENFLDRGLARKLCRLGLSVGIFNFISNEDLITEDLTIHDRQALLFLNSLDLALENQKRPLTLIGASLGGIQSSVAFGAGLKSDQFKNLKLIQSLVLTAIGGPQPDLLMQSKSKLVKKQTQRRMQTGKYRSLNDLKTSLEEVMYWNVALWTEPSQSNRVLFYQSQHDIIVPTALQERLWSMWGKPRRKKVCLNHELTIFWVYNTQGREIFNFIVKNQD